MRRKSAGSSNSLDLTGSKEEISKNPTSPTKPRTVRRSTSNVSDSFGDFIDSEQQHDQYGESTQGNVDSYLEDEDWQDADLVAGFSPVSPVAQRPPSLMPTSTGNAGQVSSSPAFQQLGDLDWAAWETPRGHTPGPNATDSSRHDANATNDDFINAFEQISMSQHTEAQRNPSPPMIDLREMEKKLDKQKNAHPTSLQPHDLDFFENFEQNPQKIMANNRSESFRATQLQGDQLASVHEAQATPMDIKAPSRNHINLADLDYFDVQKDSSASPEAAQSPSGSSRKESMGSWTESAGQWAGTFRKTLGSIRGHLPSARDFYVSDESDNEKANKEEGSSRDPADNVDGRKPHTRRLATVSGHSQSTPFSTAGNAFSPPQHTSPVRTNTGTTIPIAGHHSTAPISGAPGFNPNRGRNWNTGDWSLSAREEEERRHRPIPVALKSRREETQEVITEGLAASLTAHLPKRLQLGKTWKLLYSSDQHGISLGTLYNKVATGLDPRNSIGAGKRSSGSASGVNQAEGWLRGASDATKAAVTGSSIHRVGAGLEISEAGLILAIKDDDENIFGAFVNEKLRPQTSYYGNGECFLWKQTRHNDDAIKTYKWTGKNEYMILTEHHYLSFGGGEGKYGLWVDGQLDAGVSSTCPAFDNEILCRQSSNVREERQNRNGSNSDEEGKFACIILEVWACGVD